MRTDQEVGSDLREVIKALRTGRRLVLLVALLCTTAAAAYAFMATSIYRSEALVQPRQEGRGSAVGTFAAQLGGLGDLYGLPLSGTSDRSVAIATLKSRTVIDGFISEKRLLPRLYESQWDSRTNDWKTPSAAPSTWDAYNKFTDSILIVSDDKKTGLVTIAIEWSDPVEAQQWVADLVARTNTYLKEKAVREGERNLAYLEDQSKKIGQVELQQSLYGLVESEMKKLMLAKGSEEYALITIDAPVVPKRRSRPHRVLVIFLGLVGGLGIGILSVIVRQQFDGVGEF